MICGKDQKDNISGGAASMPLLRFVKAFLVVPIV
jgi:hypothetical protein